MAWLWRSVLYVPRHDTPLNVVQTSSGEHEGKYQSEFDQMGYAERETTILTENKIISYKEGVKAKWFQVGLKVRPGQHAQAESVTNALNFRKSTITVTGEDKNCNSKFRPYQEATYLKSCIVDKAKSPFYLQTSESKTKSSPLGKRVRFDSAIGTKGQVQTGKKSNDQTVIASKVPILTISFKKQITGRFGHYQISKEFVNRQEQRNLIISELKRLTNELGATPNVVLRYLSGKLSGVYNNIGQYLQSTQDIIRQYRAGGTSTCSQYMTMVQRKQHETSPKSKPKQNKPVVNLTGNCPFVVPGVSKGSAILDVAEWNEGSMRACNNEKPLVNCQRLAQFPKCLLTLQCLPQGMVLSHLYAVMPEIAASCQHILAIYWMSVASWKQPIPQPSCVLLSGSDLYAVSASLGDHQVLSVFHHLSLSDIKEIQVGFAGRHVRLLGSTENSILVIFTHCEELTRKLCHNLLKSIAPTMALEGAGAHPLLQADLSGYSLDWSSHIPDIILDSGLRVTSRFKRNLADLLYIIHGNLEMTNKPSLANIHVLLYTYVQVENDCTSHQGVLCQFLLTDTHISLVQADAVFHPVPQGSTTIPPQPQFQIVELRRRSDIRYVFMREREECKKLDIFYSAFEQDERKSKAREGQAHVPVTSDCKTPTVWKLTFSCTSDATTLVNHLSV